MTNSSSVNRLLINQTEATLVKETRSSVIYNTLYLVVVLMLMSQAYNQVSVDPTREDSE